MQTQYHYLSYTLAIFWIALLTVVPVSLTGLLAAIFSIKWLLVLSIKSPNGLIKFGCALLSLIFMQISGLLSFSVNGFIHLAVLGVFLKFLETQDRKDIRSLLYLMLFVGMTPLLLNQEILQACLAFLVFLFTLNNLVIIGQSNRQISRYNFLRTLRFSILQLLICLPIMLILFLMFPRLPPLWAMPNPDNSAKTGLSDRMSPGSIAQLAESNQRAFRVSFLDDSGELITDSIAQPTMQELYWRVLTMDRYDGATWHRSEGESEPLHSTSTAGYKDIRRYRLYMDKTTFGWLAILNRPIENLSIGQWWSDGTARLQKSELAGKKKRFIYEAKASYQAYQVNSIEVIEYQQLLQLPEKINPRTRELAKSLRFLSSSVAVSDAQFIKNILDYFAQDFIYTWQPPLLTSTSQMDQFLFESKQGFCGHYASALAVMARMQGIPARIVNGYLGGSFNSHGGFWEIQQKEAHAWVELYYNNQWHRVDPTAVVSDIRVSQGMDSLIAPTRNLVEKALNNSLFVSLHQRLQAIGHFWDQNVLGYDSTARIDLMTRVGEIWRQWQLWCYLLLFSVVITVCVFKPYWIARLFLRIHQRMPIHQRLMNKFDKILFNHLGDSSLILSDIHNLSISERKQLIQSGNTLYQQLSLQFLTTYQQWRFNPTINGIKTGEGRKVIIKLKKILSGLAKLKQ